MKYTVLTLFPEIIDAYFASSIMAKAVARGIVEYRSVNIRDYALDRHRTCDDAPYGGGPGMLMLPEPLGRALEAAGAVNRFGGQQPDAAPAPGLARVVYLSPSGRPFDQALARELAAEKELILLCGRYEGIDQRIIDAYADDEISVGDYVLSSGEVAALAVIDATYRLVEQVITPASLEEESFSGGLLEYPQYTRPEIYGTLKVPEVLLSGHHENIRRWRLEKQVEKTLALRPDLIRLGEEKGLFDGGTRKIIEAIRSRGPEGSGKGET
ncbi:MAG: tRNA (guanosine(37)-N1)-methyltransferase TrmD [Treponema sp.]|jgi:tRNA (guanine37-N1)-methyltransferase|nr:tRNA (guanosine(37)-N1)-methyltransferase TrmD [Treponema sp.]